MNVFGTWIITPGLRQSSVAKLEGKASDPTAPLPGLTKMFTTPLISKTGSDTAPITGWMSSGWLSEEERDYINSQLPGPFEYSDGTVTDTEGKRSEGPHEFMSRKGYRIKPDNNI